MVRRRDFECLPALLADARARRCAAGGDREYAGSRVSRRLAAEPSCGTPGIRLSDLALPARTPTSLLRGFQHSRNCRATAYHTGIREETRVAMPATGKGSIQMSVSIETKEELFAG